MARMRLVPLPRDGEEWFLLAVAVLFLAAATCFALSLNVPLPWIFGVATGLFAGLLIWLVGRVLTRMDRERQIEWNRPEGSKAKEDSPY